MSKEDVLNYVMSSPENTNRAVLSGLLNSLEEGNVPLSSITHETWTFTLDDNTTIEKEVVLWIGQE